MWDLKACLVCLSTDVVLFNLDENQLRHQFNLLSGLQITKGNGMPNYLCLECVSYIRKFIKFRDKCHRAHFALKQLILKKKTVKKSMLKSINRNSINLKPSLSYLDVSRSHFEQVKFQWVKGNRGSFVCNDIIPVVSYTTLTKDGTLETAMRNGNLSDLQIHDVKIENESTSADATEGIDNFTLDITKQSENNFDDNDYFDSDIETRNYANENNESHNNPQYYKFEIDDKLNVNETLSKNEQADGSNLDEEYATMYPITMKEAKAAVEILKMFSNGKYRCTICNKAFLSEKRLSLHSRMHDKYVSGNYYCEICSYYYKTDFLLKTHMTEKHMYKYVCRKCPEVNFDRTSAKQHYLLAHLQKRYKRDEDWYKERPKWLSNKGGKRVKGSSKAVSPSCPGKKRTKLPDDFLIYSPVRQEEQYQMVLERKETRNYQESLFKCDLCYKGFRESTTYEKHMQKHNPEISGKAQCDMCKLYFKDTRKLYKHMTITHLYKYSCQQCSYVCYNKGQAHPHYKWHRNVTYKCEHCNKEFKKMSTRLTHIRIKHPSTNICPLCGHSFVSDNGLYCHKQISHTKEEIEALTRTEVDKSSPFYCADCDIQFVGQQAFDTHLGSSSKHSETNLSTSKSSRGRLRGSDQERPRGRRRLAGTEFCEIINTGAVSATNCEVCGVLLVNDVQARKHYEAEHPGADFLKRYMCDVCGHTTRQYANLMVHMRTHTNEKPYGCPHCDRRFSMPSNRDRHLVVHTGEKRYQCQHCNRRFTQSSAVKLHIQTVHLKIPYAPWDKKNRKRRKELEGAGAPPAAPAGLPPPHKLMLDAHGDYLNAYITYNDD